jgi:Domain of unknown function (DUF4180)
VVSEIVEVHGVRVLQCEPEGPLLCSDRDALEVVGEALGQGAALVSLPVSRLCPEFFSLSSRIAGDIAQKFVNYRLRLAVVGDITGHLDASASLRDFVREANRGNHLWFVTDDTGLEARLAGVRPVEQPLG